MSVGSRQRRQQAPAPTIKLEPVTGWPKGRNTRLDIDRMPHDALRVTGNAMLDQNGTATQRPGLKPWGTNNWVRGSTGTLVATNLVPNPSFETNTTFWNTYLGAGLSRSTTQAYSGTYSLAVATTSGSNRGVGADYIVVSPSTTYTLSAYVYVPTGVTLNGEIDESGGGGGYIGFTPFTPIVGNNAWQRLTLTFTTSATTGRLEQYFYCNATTTFYIDAVMLQTGSTASTYFDGSVAAVDDQTTGISSVYAWTGTAHASSSTKTTYTYAPYPILGQVFEYTRQNGTTFETWNIWMENRSGTGYVYTSKDGGTPQLVTGKTFSVTSAKPRYEQIYGKVSISNGVDNLSFMDVQTQVITPMTSLSAASISSATPQTPLTTTPAGFLNLRYRVTAANQGETAASTAVIALVNKDRSAWNGTTEYVAVVINRVSGASRYNIYVGTQAGNEFYLDTIEDPGSGSTVTYNDIGSVAETTTRIAPAGDSTSGPKVTRTSNIKGQIYMVGDADNPGRIWFGGTGANTLDFSSYNGGGWVEPNKGGKDLPVVVKAFRDGKGTPMAACLSKGTNGAGKRYLLQPTTTTLGDTVISYMAVTEDNGGVGTDSPDAVLYIDNALIYPSRLGWQSSTTKANIQNIISDTNISDTIGRDVENLSAQYMENAVGLTYGRQLLFSVPYASTTNSQIWVLDLRQKGAWMSPWYIAADWMWQYAENTTGTTKTLMVVGNRFMELDPATKTQDNGVAWPWNISTGGIKISEDGSQWMSVIDVTFIFERPQGNFNLSVDAYTEDAYTGDGPTTFAEVMPSSAASTVGAIGRYGIGGSGFGAMSIPAIPVAVSSQSARKQWTIDIDEECNMLTCSVGSTEANVSGQLAEIIVRYVPIGFKEIDNE